MAAVQEVETFLALEIFFVCLVVALLSRLKRKASKNFAQAFVSDSPEVLTLEKEISDLKKEMNSPIDMRKRVLLFAQKAEKEYTLKKLDGASKFKIASIEHRCYVILTVLMEGSRVAFIILNRYTPVAKLESDVFWPLSNVLAYPTGIPGTLGAPIWGVACYITIATILSLVSTK